MGSTRRARFSGGTLKPMETVELKEGEEVTITIVSSRAKSNADWLNELLAAGQVWLTPTN
jgi:predicted DNA-binding antitoxin AbrB/MazE fold protein